MLSFPLSAGEDAVLDESVSVPFPAKTPVRKNFAPVPKVRDSLITAQELAVHDLDGNAALVPDPLADVKRPRPFLLSTTIPDPARHHPAHAFLLSGGAGRIRTSVRRVAPRRPLPSATAPTYSTSGEPVQVFLGPADHPGGPLEFVSPNPLLGAADGALGLFAGGDVGPFHQAVQAINEAVEIAE